MRQMPPTATTPTISPLLLADQLITLAEQAGQAGYRDAARRLVALACRMVEHAPRPSLVMAAPRPATAARRRYRSPGPAPAPAH